MRVAHIITRLIVGGAQENTVDSVLGLRTDFGHEVWLISGIPGTATEGDLAHRFDSCPGVLRVLPELVRPVHPWKDWRALVKLTRALSAQRPDIVHTHSGKAGVLGRLAAARAGVPIIIHTIHGPSFGPFQGRVPNVVFRAAERLAARSTHHFVVVAEAMREQYLAAGIGKPNDYTLIRSGFDVAAFINQTGGARVRQELGFSPEDVVIGKIARLFANKGHEDLFAIAPQLVRQNPRIKFLLVGDGHWRGRFERAAQDPALRGRVVFTGLVRPEQVAPLVSAMDLLVHLSTREGLARALPQALAAGKPVISYDCDGAREVCLTGQTGFLVPRGDRAGLQERLLMLAADPELRRQLGEQGRRMVLARFTTAGMVRELHELYLRLAIQRGVKA
jgi:glycosyltransferase involved in cell wall biosynthesis